MCAAACRTQLCMSGSADSPTLTAQRPPSTVYCPTAHRPTFTFNRSPSSTVHLPPPIVHRPPCTDRLQFTSHRPSSTVHRPLFTVQRSLSNIVHRHPPSTVHRPASTAHRPSSPSPVHRSTSIVHRPPSTFHLTAIPPYQPRLSRHQSAAAIGGAQLTLMAQWRRWRGAYLGATNSIWTAAGKRPKINRGWSRPDGGGNSGDNRRRQ